MESLRKSLSSHKRRFSGGGTSRSRHTSHEELPILSEDLHLDINDGDVTNPRGAAEPVLSREPSVEFWRGGAEAESSSSSSSSDETLPTIIVGEGVRNTTMCREVSLDMDNLDHTEEINSHDHSIRQHSFNNDNNNNMADLRVSFDKPVPSDHAVPPMAETPRIWQANSPCFDKSSGSDTDDDEVEVLRCTSNRSFQTSSMLRLKTRSRLLDPPDEVDSRSTCPSMRVPKSGPLGKSSPLFSGLIGKSVAAEDEEDESWEEDIPEEYKKVKVSFFFLLQWTVLIGVTAALIATLVIPHLKQRVIWKLKLWKWLLVLLVFVCGRLVAGWGIRLIVFFIERNFVLRKKLLYFVYGIRDAVQNCLWLGMVLVVWICLLNQRVERGMNGRNLKYVTKVLVCLLVGTVLWLVKTLIIKVMASSFHVSTYFDRIQESLFSQFVIETLSGPPMMELEQMEEEENKMGNDIRIMEDGGDGGDLKGGAAGVGSCRRSNAGQGRSMRFSRVPSIGSNNVNSGRMTMDNLHKLNTQNVSAWKMKRMMKIVRRGLLSTLDEQIGSTAYEDETTMMIRSEKEAKAVAKKIFQNVAMPGSRYIYLDDLLRFMSEDEALKTMILCAEGTDVQRIRKSCLKNWLVNAFRDRKALTLTLNDTKTAVNKLHGVVNVIISIVIIIIWLLILGIASSKFLMFTVSELVLFVFMFGNTCKTAFESVIFLFVIHPFDVGDRCEIDGVQLVVEEMNILNTIFLRYDNQKVMFPNSTLSLRPIGNYYRSPSMGDGVEFFVHMATPAEKINLMKQKIISYIENKKEHWQPAPMVIVKEFEDLTRIRMAVWLCHTINHQDMGEKFARRALLMEEMIKIFKELDIQYRFLPLDINVRSLPPATTSRLPPTWVVNNS